MRNYKNNTARAPIGLVLLAVLLPQTALGVNWGPLPPKSVGISGSIPGQHRNAGRKRALDAEAARPKLVLVIVVDQFRYDYIERFSDLFGEGGFKRLLANGALFTNANYDYVPTYTAPGHAAIFTGSVPALDGIVGNEWFDRSAGKVREMVSDDMAHLLTTPNSRRGDEAGDGARGSADERGDRPGASPRNLIGTTIGDQMRLSDNFRSKVVAVSLKDRAAVLPGGLGPNGAYWFDALTGTFVTSDYYMKQLPPWVDRFNTTTRPDQFFGAQWKETAAASAYDRAEPAPVGGGQAAKGFPHVVTGGVEKPGPAFFSAFESTPFASEYLEQFAKTAIESESLGAGPFPDMLSISFSSPDLVGHAYGPDSAEIEDIYIRLDQVIADLLNYIDRKVGLSNTIVVVTGDHGVSPAPEYLQSHGLPGQRISGRVCRETAEKALTARFGGSKWILAAVNDQLYLDREQLAQLKVDPAEAERLAGEAVLTVPGIMNFYTRSQILSGSLQSSPISRRVINGFNAQRSGDVWFITKPFTFVGEGTAGTTHGSPFNYDTHVPVIIYGKGIHAGRYAANCSPSDIAPTLAALLRIEPPSNPYGRVLTEALGSQSVAAGGN
jgi:predicted AlkP superfamily pyrophosphatase or phosphodiesterase